MPYRRKGSPSYYVELRPKGYPHKIGPRSTGLETKRAAEQVEGTLRDLAASGHHEPLDKIRAGEVSVTDVHAAKVAGTLDRLLRQVDDPLLVDAAERFIELSCSHRDEYGIRRLLEVAPAGARLSWITDPEHLEDVLLHYLRHDYTPGTIRREFSPIRKFVRRRFGEQVQKRVFSHLDLPALDRDRIRYLEPDEIARVKKASGDWWNVFGLYIATGMRRGELTSLQRRDVNLGPEIPVVTIEAGKTELAARDLPVPGEMGDLLRRWIHETAPRSADPLFPKAGYRRVYTVWLKVRERAGVDDCTLHGLRHTFAVQMAKAGIPMMELKSRLGHRTLETTMKYAKYAPDGATKHLTAGMTRMGLVGETPTVAPTVEGGAAVSQGERSA